MTEDEFNQKIADREVGALLPGASGVKPDYEDAHKIIQETSFPPFNERVRKDPSQIAVKDGAGGWVSSSGLFTADPQVKVTIHNDPAEAVKTQDHYARFKIEPIDFTVANNLGYREGNIIKYVCRHPFKGQQLQDLYKARDYLDRIIADCEAKEYLPDTPPGPRFLDEIPI